MEKQVCGPLEGTLIHGIAVRHMIRIVSVTHVPVLPFHGVGFHMMVAVKKFPSAAGGSMLVSI